MYLCYCEAGFAERRINVVQTLLAKPHFRSAHAGELHSVGEGAERELSYADAG